MTIGSGDFGYIQGLLHRQAGVVVERGKEYLVETRLGPLAQREGYPSLDALIVGLRQAGPGGPLGRKVVEAMVIHETSFFRDWAPFEAMRLKVLPELIAHRAVERELTIWCGAASSGQEPYSLALLIKEHFPALATWKVRIVATDISSAILARARAGRFTQVEMNRGLPAAMLVRNFHREAAEWQISDEVRRLVEFRELNLTDGIEAVPNCDVIFLRNVLIYFDLETRRRIFSGIRRALRHDGTLFLGSAETTIHVDDAFEPAWIEKAVCFRVRSA